MFTLLFCHSFQKVFGFAAGTVSAHWEDKQVGMKLQELAERVDASINRVYEIWQERARLISGLDYNIWFQSMRRANTDCVRAADDFSWAQILAKEAGFKVKKSYRNQVHNGVAVVA